MRALIIILVVVVAVAIGALAAQPLTPPAVVSDATAAALAFEPAWMVLSGAALLVLAGVVRRLAP